MKILFAFENPLPSPEADAEVFVTTARHLAPYLTQCWLHVPAVNRMHCEALGSEVGMSVVRAWSPVKPAALRHLCCGLTLVLRREFRDADMVYTRNLWIAWLSLLFGQRVVFDHYRPWPDQIPPLQFWIYRLMRRRKFLVNICHSEYTRGKYLHIGVAEEKLICVHNGFDPQRLQDAIPIAEAKEMIGVDRQVRTVVYTGRVNHKKGLDLVIEAAKQLPRIQFILVGSNGEGPIETLAEDVANVQIVPWQTPETLAAYVYAADCLLIPSSSQPLTRHGSTVLPLKLFFYLASGRPIIAGDTPDVREVLRHENNAILCRPDHVESLISGINTLMNDAELRQRLGTAALADSRNFTWGARARTIADIVERKLQPGRSEPAGAWGKRQSRTWRRQSWRWLSHLVRNRAWVLPPIPAPQSTQPISSQQRTPPHC